MWGILYILGNGSVTENPAICSTHTSLLKIQILYKLHKKSPPHFVTEFNKSPIQQLSNPLTTIISPTCTICTKILNLHQSTTKITRIPYFKPLSRTHIENQFYIEKTHPNSHQIITCKSPKFSIKSTLPRQSNNLKQPNLSNSSFY